MSEERVLICGDRNWSNFGMIKFVIIRMNLAANEDGKTLVIIEGEARGADSQARIVAESLGVEVRAFPAEWHKYGKAAGPIRNRQMLDEGDPHVVVAFHNNIAESKGTKDMVTAAEKRGLPVFICSDVDGVYAFHSSDELVLDLSEEDVCAAICSLQEVCHGTN